MVGFTMVLPLTMNAVLAGSSPNGPVPNSVSFALSGIIQSITILVPTLYLMHRSTEGIGVFGWKKLSLVSDVAGGLALGCVALLAALITDAALSNIGLEPNHSALEELHIAAKAGGLPCILTIAFLILNSFSEEMVMRAFVMLRLKQLFRSTAVAVIVSSLFFAGYHIYQGVGGAISVLITGLIFGGFYIWQARVVPLIIAHTFMNLVLMFTWIGN
ncbi:MAG: CPBP family intramembrane glutamic endopeptidase [Fimbriimonas sp.]